MLRAGQCIVKGSREAAQLVEARPQLVVSTAALRHQLVGGGPGSHSFYGVFGVKGTLHASFTCNLLMDFRMRLIKVRVRDELVQIFNNFFRDKEYFLDIVFLQPISLLSKK